MLSDILVIKLFQEVLLTKKSLFFKLKNDDKMKKLPFESKYLYESLSAIQIFISILSKKPRQVKLKDLFETNFL